MPPVSSARSRSPTLVTVTLQVRPFVRKGKKNDPADAAALCAAASRPDMMFVPVKNTEQQGILALHSARSLLVKQQTMLANAMRGLATEFGLTVPQGIGRLEELLALVAELVLCLAMTPIGNWRESRPDWAFKDVSVLGLIGNQLEHFSSFTADLIQDRGHSVYLN